MISIQVDNMTTIIVAGLLMYVALGMMRLVQSRFLFSFSKLRGPGSTSIFLGATPAIRAAPPGQTARSWFKQFGSTVRYRSTGFIPAVLSQDLGFASYVMIHDQDFGAPQRKLDQNRRILGPESFDLVDVHSHRRLRKILAQPFSAEAVGKHTELFLSKGYELRGAILRIGEEQLAKSLKNKGIVIPSSSCLGMMTTDTMGLSTFGIDFETIKHRGSNNELLRGWRLQLHIWRRHGMSSFIKDHLELFLPCWMVRGRRYLLNKVAASFARMSDEILQRKKREVEASQIGDLTTDDFGGTNVISSLLKSNMAVDVKSSSRLSDGELKALIPFMLIASTITTNESLVQALVYLTKDTRIQTKLREEVQTLEDYPTTNELQELEYLEAFVREVLRLSPFITVLAKEAKREVAIPLAEPVIGMDGKTMNSVVVQKGDAVEVSLININTREDVFGPDACKFRPERHLDGSIGNVDKFPSIWGHSTTFTYGSHSCLGFRFAVLEMKVVLFILLRKFKMSQPDDQEAMLARTVMADGTGEKDIPIKLTPLPGDAGA